MIWVKGEFTIESLGLGKLELNEMIELRSPRLTRGCVQTWVEIEIEILLKILPVYEKLLDREDDRFIEYEKDRYERRLNDQFAGCIRAAQHPYFWNSPGLGSIYREKSLHQLIEACINGTKECRKRALQEMKGKTTIEHTLPVSVIQEKLKTLYLLNKIDKRAIIKWTLAPTSIIKKDSETKINREWNKTTPNIEKPFLRYEGSGIKIIRDDGKKIVNDQYSLSEHFSYIKNKKEIPCELRIHIPN